MPIREISAGRVTDTIARLCVEANRTLPEDVAHALCAARAKEPWPPARQTLGLLEENLAAARQLGLPICQDTGMACVFLEIGQDAHITGGDLNEAVNEGVRRGYTGGLLRKSVVADPIRRGNTNDNTPAMLHVDIVPGDGLAITVAPKGFGSENMSRIAMLPPARGREGVAEFVLETLRLASSNACPPMVVGVGIGATFDAVALLAKKALLRGMGLPHPDPYYAALEGELLTRINALGIGPAGLGGYTTALGVSIETAPTHIAGLPVAVNISCHATRRMREVL